MNQLERLASLFHNAASVYTLISLRALSQADETSEVLKIPSQYHSSLIGQNGKYAIRLEEKYSVKITFPRQSAENGEGRTREPLKSDEVLIKGGKKGVAGAKSELMDVSLSFCLRSQVRHGYRRQSNSKRSLTMSSSSRFPRDRLLGSLEKEAHLSMKSRM